MKIHITMVHWHTDYWIDIQLKYFQQFITHEFKTYAWLNGISSVHHDKFDWISSDNIVDHGTKLNLLADQVLEDAKEDDWLIFIDGDAFPVADVVKFGHLHLSDYPLIAVQRLENLGDIQPHPCFCLTTVGFWKKIKGDWQKGDFRWTNSEGRQVNDVGGTLLKILDQKSIKWLPLNRSNQNDLHPLMFGVYGDLVYHHGAGFRNPAFRIDKYISPGFDKRKALFDKTQKFLPKHLNKFLFSPYNKIIKTNNKMHRKVLSWIDEDDAFYRRFTSHENSTN